MTVTASELGKLMRKKNPAGFSSQLKEYLSNGNNIDEVIFLGATAPGRTLLEMAIKESNAEVVKILISEGAKIKDGETLESILQGIDVARLLQDIDMARFPLRAADECRPINQLSSASQLLVAVRDDNLETFSKKLDEYLNIPGNDINCLDMDVRMDSLLMIAVRRGDLAIVNLLIERGADVLRSTDRDGNSVLPEALERGHTEIVDSLIKAIHLPDVQFYCEIAVQLTRQTPFLDSNLAKIIRDYIGNEEIGAGYALSGVSFPAQSKGRPARPFIYIPPLISDIRRGDVQLVQMWLNLGASITQDSFAMSQSTSTCIGVDEVYTMLAKAETFILVSNGQTPDPEVKSHNQQLEGRFHERGAAIALQTGLTEFLAVVIGSYLSINHNALESVRLGFRSSNPLIIHTPMPPAAPVVPATTAVVSANDATRKRKASFK